MTGTALLLLAHGSRDPAWAGPIHALAARLRVDRPDLDVRVAFLEQQPPAAAEVVRVLAHHGVTRVWIAPLLLGAGAHVRRDVAALAATLRVEHPAVSVELLPILGEIEAAQQGMTAGLSAAVPRQG